MVVKLIKLTAEFVALTVGLWLLWDYVLAPALLTPNVPEIKDKYWGPGQPKPDDVTIKPFQIKIKDEVLTDLKRRLDNARYVEPLEDSNFNYGFNHNYLKEVVSYWKTKYDWRKTEAKLNAFEHYKTQIEGLNIHFMRARPKSVPSGVKVLPLIMVHGWPGTVHEFIHILPLLTTPQKGSKVVFDVICPSIPGYAFSDASSKIGMNALETAKIFNKLMQRLGFKQYYAQGGDWGHVITNILATFFPDNILGWHTNTAITLSNSVGIRQLVANIFPWAFVSSRDYEKINMKKVFLGTLLETGYAHIQASKPDTVGTGLNDSPLGLAAYILEKFSTWTNKGYRDLPDGGLTKKFSMDDLLGNVMIYWVTESITSSQRYYAENFAKTAIYQIDEFPLVVPHAIAEFPHEIILTAEAFLRRRCQNLVQYTVMSDGGHFAALEMPKELAADIHSFVNKVEFGSKLE